jgi:hypothetical protein
MPPGADRPGGSPSWVDLLTRPNPSRTRTTDTVVVWAPQQPVAVAFCQHPAPRGLVNDRSQATQTPHSLFQSEMDKATKLVLW